MTAWRFLLLLLMLQGCAYGELVCPKRGGDTWREVASPNFRLITNLDADEAKARSRELERLHDALAFVVNLDFPFRGSKTDPIEIVHFAHHEQLERFTGGRTAGLMTKVNGKVTLVTTESSGAAQRNSLLLHELAHRFLAHQVSVYPQWLTEGIAGFYESLKIEGGRARVGFLPDDYRGAWFGNSSFAPPINAMREMEAAEFYAPKTQHHNYYGAWRLVHFLSNSSTAINQRWQMYTRALASGVAEERAWERAFSDLPDLETRVREYRGSRNVKTWAVEYKASPLGEMQIRKLDDGEVHELWARMSILASNDRNKEQLARNEKRLKAELADAQKHGTVAHQGEMVRILLLDEGTLEEQLRTLRSLVTSAPDNAVALRTLISLEMNALAQTGDLEALRTDSKQRKDMDARVAKLESIAAVGADFDVIARYYAAVGAPAKGLEYGVMAIERAPSCASCYETHAMLFAQAGNAAQAHVMQEHAVELYGEQGIVPPRALMLLESYKSRAAAMPALGEGEGDE